MNPLCLEEGVGLIPWSPLAGGVLAGAPDRFVLRIRLGLRPTPADEASLTA